MGTTLPTLGSGSRCQHMEGTVGLPVLAGVVGTDRKVIWPPMVPAPGPQPPRSSGPQQSAALGWFPSVIHLRGGKASLEEMREGQAADNDTESTDCGWPESTPEGPTGSKSGRENVLPRQCLRIMPPLARPNWSTTHRGSSPWRV